MFIKDFEGHTPKIDPKAFVAETAVVIGKTELKEFSSLWYNVVARGDVNRIEVGRYTNIQDNSVLHVADNHACVIGDYVTVGHSATVHACTIEDYCLIGMGATVLDGSVIGRGSIVAAGSVVTKNTVVPPFSLVAGIPARVIKTLDESNLENIKNQAVKYEYLWTTRYGHLPEGGGETYEGGKIV